MKTVYTIGIDFGTSNSCVTYATYLDRGYGDVEPNPVHRPEAISFGRRETIPTVIFLGDGPEQPPMFGEPAEEKAAYYPELTRSGFKLRLAHPQHGREAYLLCKQFMQHLRRRAAEVVPLDKKDPSIRIETVVGHPVQWSADQREETRRAAMEAGFPNVRLEEESMAALYSHLCDDVDAKKPKPGSRVLMVDMGGGTTDFAFLQLAMEETQRPVSIPVDPAPVVPPWGDGRRSYGGRDLDQLMLSYMTRDWDQNEVKQYRQALMREVRRFKEAFSARLSKGEHAHESLWLIGDDARDVKLTRAEFEEIAAEYIAHFEVLLRGALHEAKLAPRQVTHLILTGGHSRWYFVDDTLKRVLSHLSTEHRTILRHPRPDQSVARGLAYDTLVRANAGGIMAPVRRAAHALWVSVPNGSLAGAGGMASGAWDEPIMMLPRGQQLPFQTRAPLRIRVEQLGLDAREACVRIRFFSGQKKAALTEREARFERGTWEQLTRAFSLVLPWAKAAVTPDQFEVLVACQVDEHELITAEVLVTRFVRGKAQEVQRQKMQLSGVAA
jgi:molecular chaperone DnaK (HSP70)